MTNSEAGKNSSPNLEACGEPSWKWMQGRVPRQKLKLYSDWLAHELTVLEGRFDNYVTKQSRNRAIRYDLNQERTR